MFKMVSVVLQVLVYYKEEKNVVGITTKIKIITIPQLRCP